MLKNGIIVFLALVVIVLSSQVYSDYKSISEFNEKINNLETTNIDNTKYNTLNS